MNRMKELALTASSGAIVGLGVACLLVAISVGLQAFGARLDAKQVVAVPQSNRFVVVSQQILDSGAKLVIIRDTDPGLGPACYAIYEAGAAAALGQVKCGR